MDGFINWATLATYGGASIMVSVLAQFTKGLGFIDRLPTQVWTYILSLVVLFPALYFTGALTSDTIVSTFFNAVIISVSANGTYSGAKRLFNGKKKEG